MAKQKPLSAAERKAAKLAKEAAAKAAKLQTRIEEHTELIGSMFYAKK